MQNWLLPEYIHDMLPEETWRVERMRAQLLDLMRKCGYEQVAPPLLEYAESLLIDGGDMDLRTFKLVDQLSGRTLALRADITPQVARIDAHLLNRRGVTRLCYAGSVLHTQPAGLNRTRELLQIGAELYGHAGLESDLEILQLMTDALALLGVTGVHLDIGHVGVFRAIARHANLGRDLEDQLFAALQSKDATTLKALTATLDETCRSALLALPTLYGQCDEVLARARRELPDLPLIGAALADLQHVTQRLRVDGIDLADLRGYHYHSGIVFAAYHAASHDAIVLGGRYDDLGKSFGRARAATGFSMDLRQLYRLLPVQTQSHGIRAPFGDAAKAAIAQLRDAGEVVVVDLPGSGPDESGCDRELVLLDGVWRVVAIN